MTTAAIESSLYLGLILTPLALVGLALEQIYALDQRWRACLLTVPWLIAGVGAYWASASQSNFVFWLAPVLIGILLSLGVRRWLQDYFFSVAVLVPASVLSFVAGIIWSWQFIHQLPLSPMTLRLLEFSIGIGLLALPWNGLLFFPTHAYWLRQRWHRPRTATSLVTLEETLGEYPLVSLHVPCYAEPPDVVCATLDSLAALKYPAFEVLVIDNNTPEPDLWEPVEAYCQQLNQQLGENRFRFFHVSPLAGAKAGALNFALQHTAESAQLVGVIDADYQVRSDFLLRLVGFFADSRVGFVQTPHDYRGWQSNLFLRACYWEYVLFFQLQLADCNEWHASYIVGTMCLVRKSALENAGGWATWCLTEDSELAVRLHGLGYRSHYLTESFGYGLIPETFLDFKKQRLRWTIGPIQQLRRYWRWYLPNFISPPWRTPSQLRFWQRILELHHSLMSGEKVLGLTLLPLVFLTLASLWWHQETLPLVPVIGYAIASVCLVSLISSCLKFRLLATDNWRDWFLLQLALGSLQHIRFVGGWQALFQPGQCRWRRTNKFRVLPQRWRALQSCQVEALLGGVCFLAALSLLPFVPPHPDLRWLAIAALVVQGMSYGAAVVMAVLSEWYVSQSQPMENALHLPGAKQSALPLPKIESQLQGFTNSSRS